MADPLYVARRVPSCPANTPAATYATAPVGLDVCFLHFVEVKIPRGHSGQTGLALVDSGQSIVPLNMSGVDWIVGDDDLLRYDYENQLGANVVFASYNTGVFTHAWQVRLVYTPMVAYTGEEPVILTGPLTAGELAGALT